MINQKHINKYYLSIATLFIFISMIGVGSAVECGSVPTNGCRVSVSTIFNQSTYNLSGIKSSPFIEDNIIIYYHLDNNSLIGENDTNIVDQSIYSHNATTNNTIFNISLSVTGSGTMYFNGANSSLRSNLPINYSSGGISFWFKSNKINQGSRIISSEIGSDNGLRIKHEGNDIKAYIEGTTDECVAQTTSDFIDTNWHYVQFTWNNSSCYLYIDGTTLNVSGTYSGGNNGSSFFTIGRYSQSQTNFFNGSLDEIIIYNRTLDIADIYSNYHKYLYFNSILLDNNVVLDCNNSLIQGNRTFDSLGVNIENLNNITIKNCQFNGYYRGILGFNTTNSVLDNITFIDSEADILRGSFFNTQIINNIFNSNCSGFNYISSPDNRENSFYNIHITGGSYNLISNNILRGNNRCRTGIILQKQDNFNPIAFRNNITNNIIYNFTDQGIYLATDNVTYSYIYNNTLINQGFCDICNQSYGYFNGEMGIHLEEHTGILSYGVNGSNQVFSNMNNIISSNYISGFVRGIFLEGTTSHTIINNNISNMRYEGIKIKWSRLHNISNNYIYNVSYGVDFQNGSINNNVSNNIIDNVNRGFMFELGYNQNNILGLNQISNISQSSIVLAGLFNYNNYLLGNNLNNKRIYNENGGIINLITQWQSNPTLSNGTLSPGTILTNSQSNITLNPGKYIYIA